MSGILTYLKHVRAELEHVAWPSTRTAISHTLVVVLIAVLLSVWVGLLDYVFTLFVSYAVGA